MDPDRIEAIKENIRKIIRQGGEDTDVQEYLSIEGFTPDRWSQAVRLQETQNIRETNEQRGDLNLSRPEAAIAKFGQGASFGLSDELRGLVAAIPGGMSPSEAIQDERNRLASASEQYPGMSLAADLTGGVASGIATAPLTLGLGVAKAPSYVRNIAAATGLGALEGAARSEGADRGQGAVVGGGLGLAGGVIGDAVVRGVRGTSGLVSDAIAARNLVNGSGRAGRVVDDQGLEVARNVARRRGMDAILKETEMQQGGLGQTALQAERTIQQAGPFAEALTPMETLGAVGEQFGSVASQTNRRLADNANRASTNMLAGSVTSPGDVGLIGEVLEEATGIPAKSGTVRNLMDMVTAARERATAAYGQFFDNAVAPERVPEDAIRSAFRRLSQNPEGGESSARALASLSRKASARPDAPTNFPFVDDAVQGPAGGYEGAYQRFANWARTASGRDVHNFRKLIDGEVQQAIRVGDASLERVWMGVRDDYLNIVDDLYPQYGAIRANAADDFALEAAYDMGSQFGRRGNQNVEALEAFDRFVTNGTPEQKNFFAMGALSQVNDAVQSSTRAIGSNNPVARIVRSNEQIGRLRQLMPDDETFKTFLDRLEVGLEIGGRAGRTTGNSQTAARQALQNRANETAGIAVQQGYNPQASLLNYAGRKVRDLDLPLTRATDRSLGVMMFGPRYRGAEGTRRLVEELGAYQRYRNTQVGQRANQNAVGSIFGSRLPGPILFGEGG